MVQYVHMAVGMMEIDREEGWKVSQMDPHTVEVDPKLESYLHKETFVSFVVLEKTDKADHAQ